MGQALLADTAYLKRRRGKNRSGYRWYVRVVIPPDVREILRKQTIERALDTSDFKEAQQRRHAVLADIFESFERARRRRITSEDIEHEAQRYLKIRLDQIIKRPDDAFTTLIDSNGNDLGMAGDAALLTLCEALGDEDWPGQILEEATNIARSYGVELPASQQRELCRSLLLAEIEALSRAIAVQKGQVLNPVTVLNLSALDPITATVRPRQMLPVRGGKGIRVGEASEAYIAHRNREKRGAWTGQTKGQARTTFRLFKEFTRDAALEVITRNDVADFLSTLSKLDPNYGRRNPRKETSLKELLEKFPAKGEQGISNRTVNRHVALLAGMFDWAIKAGRLDGANPAKGHHQSKGKHEDGGDSARRSFTTDELKKLLTGSLFESSFAERTQPARHTVETTLAWLIPIALFSGMRLDEVCGMRTADVMEEDGILFFDLRSHEGRRLKTAAARRRVPVHSELMLIGFGRYLAKVRRQGHEYLFPALKPGGPDGKRSWYVSKRFTTYRRAVGVNAKETVFHCFRKNAATALERARVPENEAVQILGHKKMTMSYGLYSSGLDLTGLAHVVEAITYPGLDLSQLKVPETDIPPVQ